MHGHRAKKDNTHNIPSDIVVTLNFFYDYFIYFHDVLFHKDKMNSLTVFYACTANNGGNCR